MTFSYFFFSFPLSFHPAIKQSDLEQARLSPHQSSVIVQRRIKVHMCACALNELITPLYVCSALNELTTRASFCVSFTELTTTSHINPSPYLPKSKHQLLFFSS
jgi:hypothetical protein